MPSHSIIESHIQGLVSLNHHGVSLLEQGRFQYAASTFQDSLTLVQQTIQLLEDGVENETSVLIDMNAKVQKALNLTLQPSRPENGYEIHSTSYVRLRVLIHSSTLGVVHKHNDSQMLLKDRSFIAIRTEHNYPSECGMHIDDLLDFETAIILHNVGIASLCMMWQSESVEHTPYTEHATICLLRAMRYLELSESLLQDLLEDSIIAGPASNPEKSENVKIEVFNGILNVESVVLRSLISVQRSMAVDSELNTKRLIHIEELSFAIEEESWTFFEAKQLKAAAAAA